MSEQGISGEVKVSFMNTNMICNICGEDLGKYKPFICDEHLRKYPTHKSYRHSDVELSDIDWIMY